MAAPPGPVARTASASSAETARGTHAFRVAGYSLHRGIGVGRAFRSATFAVGGHRWCLLFYPDGNSNADEVVFSIELLGKNVEARARADLRLVNPSTGASAFFPDEVRLFSTTGSGAGTVSLMNYMERSKLEASPYLHDDCIVIECDITVYKVPRLVEDTVPVPVPVPVPPSDLSDNLGKLLQGKKGADVTFKVKDELFSAHKIVLAMRSPVFDAELYGPLGDSTRKCITVDDMQPDVFRALLQFIYTDSMPAMDDLDAGDRREMIKHLLVAADRYAMERLKLICESMLCETLDVENVATTFSLADQHHCKNLRDFCVRFINSSNRIDAVVASKEYTRLKRACPTVLVDILEKVTKHRKI
ncbi:hypothetical protein ACP70R_003132 [Stipagrostis hirtigluma subsp. patula]